MAENYSTHHHHTLSHLQAIHHSTNSARYQLPESSKPEFLICLIFSGHFHPLREIAIFFDLEGFLCREKSRKTIRARLGAWRSYVTRQQREDLVAFSLRRTRTAFIRMPARHNYLQVEFRVSIDIYLELIMQSSIDRVIQGSMDEVRMVPTNETSIENLMESKKIFTGSVDGACAVCMDEFDRDCEVVCMPCFHVFHGDCIKKWLRASHYCPICRFEMPTS